MTERDTYLQLQDFYPYRLSVLSNLISEHIAEAYKPYGITIPMWRIMAVLAEFPGLTATEIAKQIAMDKPAITRAVKALIAANYVQREASQHDGRSSHLQLTKKGHAIYAQVTPEALAYEQELLSILSASEIRTLDKALSKLFDHCSCLLYTSPSPRD